MGESGVIKSVVIFLLLAVFSLVAGSMVADSAKEAIIPALLVAAIAALIYLGKNCWWLIFIAPPVISAFGFMSNMPVGYGVAGIVLLYWVILTALGHTRMTWNGVKGLDILTLIMVLYFLSTWVRHPVTIGAFTSIYDEGESIIGGQDYIWCLGAVLFYITLSTIELEFEGVVRILKIMFWLSLGVSLFVGIMSVLHVFQNAETQDYANYRIVGMSAFATYLLMYIFSKYTIERILFSWSRIIVVLGAFALVVLSAYRSALLNVIMYILLASICLRRFVVFFILSICTWGIVVVLSHGNIFNSLPWSAQRSLSAIPGIELNDKGAIANAKGSLNWRAQLWELGWNPNSGYIQDYTFGDGYALSLSDVKRERMLFYRGELGYQDVSAFAEAGSWHHGGLIVIHRTGYVGLFFLMLWLVCSSVIAFRLSRYIGGMVGREYVYIHSLSFVSSAVLFYWYAGGWKFVFEVLMFHFALLKVIYALAIKTGIFFPLYTRKEYIPLIQRRLPRVGM